MTSMTSVTEEMTLWCYIEGEDAVFSVDALSTLTVDRLKVKIKNTKSNVLSGIDPSRLTLTKVRYIMVSM